MNIFGFLKLMKGIFRPGLPDLDWIESQGLLAVKIAQHFALRVDFLEREKCQHLSRLFRQTKYLPPRDVDELLSRFTDDEWREVVSSIDEEALASASVGQVHRGKLQSGEEVVVKLLKGDFRQSFQRDVRWLRRLFQVTLFFQPRLRKVFDPVGAVDAIADYTLKELDLRQELEGQEILKKIQREAEQDFDLSRLKFPKIYENLTREGVLVSEYLEGPTFDELLERGELDYQRLLDLFQIHGFYMFGVGTFHGDLHPGNVILQGDDIYFVDTGAISYVNEKTRRGLFNFFDALSVYDYERCASQLNNMAEREIEGKAYEAFHKEFLQLYENFTMSTVAEVSLTQQMMKTIRLGVMHGMVFEKGMFPIIKSLMYMDGMVLRAKGDSVLVNDMRVYLDEFKAIVNQESAPKKASKIITSFSAESSDSNLPQEAPQG